MLESLDISDTAQLALMNRMIFQDYTAKEKMLKIPPLKGQEEKMFTEHLKVCFCYSCAIK
jgi:hypothetical protein